MQDRSGLQGMGHGFKHADGVSGCDRGKPLDGHAPGKPGIFDAGTGKPVTSKRDPAAGADRRGVGIGRWWDKD